MGWRARAWASWLELRTALTGVDPGLVRLRLAGVALAAMLLAAGVMTGVRALTGQPVTVVLMAGVLAMISNIAVNEPDPRRLRVTTAVLVVPAALAVTAGTLIAPYRIPADVVFVLIMAAAAWARRFGARGSAVGMPAVMGYFFTQFLQAKVAELPWLLLAVAVGIGSTLLVRGWLVTDDPERTLARLQRAFRAHVHGVVDAVVDLLDAAPQDRDRARDVVGRRRARLNETALLIADQMERTRDAEAEEGAGSGGDGGSTDDASDGRADRRAGATDDSAAELHLLDVELAAERLTVAARRLVQEGPVPPGTARRLLAGLRQLLAATATGVADGMVPTLLDGARRSVDELVADTAGTGDRAQRVAFAIARLADALGGDEPLPVDLDPAEPEPGSAPAEEPAHGLDLHTRQAVQVAVATAGAIVAGELISPARWYWAVITAFIVFAGTTSRGDVLSRGSQRVVGTIGGVVAGMALALLVGQAALPALVLLFGCVFLALYLVRVSQTLMAFWITAVLALLYGLIGQFSVETLVVRVEETVAGAAMGMLAGYLILPQGTRAAYGDALDDLVSALHAVLDASAAQLLGRVPAGLPLELVRDMDAALGVLRARAKPLDNPLPRRRGRSSWQRALRVFSAVEHYARRIARLSAAAADPTWAPTFEPALDRVRANIDGLVALLLHRDGPAVRSAEDEMDAAEAHAARTDVPAVRLDLLSAVRMLRRIDQAVVAFADDLGGPPHDRDRTGATSAAG